MQTRSSTSSLTEVSNTPRAGSSSQAEVVNATSNGAIKQGAYGKVRIHKAPMATSLDEVLALASFAMGHGFAGKSSTLRTGQTADYKYCEDMLVKVSRSFAAVILHLPDHLRKAVCLFYLVLRVSVVI